MIDLTSDLTYERTLDLLHHGLVEYKTVELAEPRLLTTTLADQYAVDCRPPLIETKAAWSPKHHDRLNGDIELLRTVAQQPLHLPCAIPCLSNRLTSKQPYDAPLLNPTGIGGPLGFDGEDPTRSHQDVIDVAVPCEVEAVDKSPTLAPLLPPRYCRRRRFPSSRG